jgi:hypothetical protein
MRKLTMLVALVTIFSLVVAVPALAVGPVTNLGGGNNNYNEVERGHCPPNGDEEVNGRGGDDRLRLNLCGDAPPEPDATDSDDDTANGNSGNDIVRVDDGDIQDTANGGNGNDTCRADLDLGDGVMDVDEPPAGPNPEGSGPEQDVGDTVHPSCETIIWNTGDFYNQT